ncbi:MULTISPECIES: ATP-binding protein [unclassified Salipiger]|uniref:sensor histidine kinase n=1 Tax=unclassified Salipiger TaxID=2640570 RepID=UPI0013BD8C04|nr:MULTISPECIES: ATP-binding protein [unclassified Salipiger]NDV48479.1 sensor histidine kinase [Salipiger sp. PrR003]NDW35296.1 sensor histidine kinase [Salipiger sp. PrR007]
MTRRGALLPRLRSAWRLRLMLVTIGALLCGALAWQLVIAELRQGLEQELLVSHRALQTEIDRFRYLPRVTGEDARIHAALNEPSDAATIDAANRYLQKIAAQTGSGRLYLLNAAGVTIAASNWSEPDSYVGHDYSFRPYFTDARATGNGAVYAIGVTTGEPGYFISARVDDPGLGVHGVMVVKIDLRPLEQAWAETGQHIAVTDKDDVVFLSSVPAWRYRPLTRLPGATLDRLDTSRLYERTDLGSSAPLLPNGSALRIEGEGRAMTLRGTPFETGWRLLAASPTWPARAAAAGTAALVLLAALLGLGLADMRRHRQRFIALRLRQTEVMERKVRQRTAELAREVEARRQVEADLRATQATLVQSEKMAALGRMSAAIVHEVSQPLAAMEATLTAAEFGLSRAPEQTAARLQSARGLIRRMQRMTKHLKNFSRREAAPLSPVCAVDVARSALALAQPRADAAGVQLQFDAPADAPMVEAGHARLEQVLMNLLHNAIEAVEPGQGEVTLSIERGAQDVTLLVTDNGPGIAPDVLPRVTEPFFSTKIGGEGLGLGLAICFEVVQQFGGRLDIRSAPGRGAEAAVILPLLESDDEREAAE